MNYLDIDDGLASVLDLVREKHAPIRRALAANEPMQPFDLEHLAGAVSVLIDAIDARTPQHNTKAVAA